VRGELFRQANHYWRVYADTFGAPHWAEDLEQRAVRHTLACLLARVAGRSPLEYLNPTERRRQREAVLRILPRAPATVADLIAAFEEQLCQPSSV
jgi:hypothetical protein